MLRLFCGIALPRIVCQRLRLLQGGIPAARWTHEEDFHITLTFIGNVDEASAEEIDEALASIDAPQFNLMLKGTGSFSRGDEPGYLWIGVEQNASLNLLKEKIDRRLERIKIPFEQRKYTPHVTVARLRHSPQEKIAEFMQHNNLFTAESFEVNEFILYRSHPANEGPFYEKLAEYPLN